MNPLSILSIFPVAFFVLSESSASLTRMDNSFLFKSILLDRSRRRRIPTLVGRILDPLTPFYSSTHLEMTLIFKPSKTPAFEPDGGVALPGIRKAWRTSSFPAYFWVASPTPHQKKAVPVFLLCIWRRPPT